VETGIDPGDLRLAQKAMRELGADTSVIKDAGYQAGLILVARALPLVPVKTGRLKANVVPLRLVFGGGAEVAGRKVPYANPIHWGWAVVSYKHKGTLKPGTYRGIKPQPFFSEALGYTKEEIFKTYDRLMQEYIDKLPGSK
jgi:hypothetical protein